MNAELFTAADTWNGGFYELAIELGPRSDERLLAALKAIWRYEDLDGCYADDLTEPRDQPRLPPELKTRLYGVAMLPGCQQAACGTILVREEDFTGGPVGPDWIVFYLSMGALSSVYSVGSYPFGNVHTSRFWREPLDNWLARIASAVFAEVPFSLALIGNEVSGEAYAGEISKTGIPAERWTGYLWREENRLVWYPPTNYENNFKFDE